MAFNATKSTCTFISGISAGSLAVGIAACSKYGMAAIGMGKVAMTAEMHMSLGVMSTASKFGASASPQAAKLFVRGTGVLIAVAVVIDAVTIVNTVRSMVNGELNEMSVKLREAQTGLTK